MLEDRRLLSIGPFHPDLPAGENLPLLRETTGLLADVDRSGSSTEDVPDFGVKGLLIVSTNVDESDGNYSPGDLSLREVLLLAAGAPGNDVIQFDNSLRGSTITLVPALGQLVIDSNVDIQGLGADQLTVDAGRSTRDIRVFYVASGVQATIAGLSVTGGNHNPGGPDPEDWAGSGIQNQGTLTLIRTVVSDNGGITMGAGIYNGGTLTLRETRVLNNYTISSGGGIYNAGTLTLEDTTISGNNGAQAGGGIRNIGTATLQSVTISDNSAFTRDGGGIWNVGDLTFTNGSISGNSTWGDGGGVFNSGSLEITNATISGNSAQFGSAGSGISNGSSGIVTLDNTIVARNGDGVNDDVFGGFDVASSYNLIGAGDGSTGLVDGVNGNQVGTVASPIDPMLGPLADNGGPTLTHALLPDSPAIDAGSNQHAQDAGLTQDQRGVGRFDAHDDDGGGVYLVDIGAYELDPSEVFGTIWNDDNADGAQDGESGIDGVSLALYLDDGDGVFEPGGDDPPVGDPQVTAGGGHYLFAALDPGDYWVEVDYSTVPLSDFVPTWGMNPLPVTLAAGEDHVADFGFRELSGSSIGTTADDEDDGNYTLGDISLREALLLAAIHPGDDIIEFRGDLAGATITLDAALGQLEIDSNVDIQGPAAGSVTVDAAGNSRVFRIPEGVAATISDLNITGGNRGGAGEEEGGGIYNQGTLTLIRTVVSDNGGLLSGIVGAGIYNGGTLTLRETRVLNNYSVERGGESITQAL